MSFRGFIVIFSLLSMQLVAVAQKSEVGLMAGVSFYMGDLNPDMPFAMSRPGGGGFFRYNFNDRFCAKATGLIGYVMADDALSSVPSQLERNLSFRSWLFEFAVTGEFNFFKYQPGDLYSRWTPYIFGGIALFKFNPQADLNGTLYELQPLGTEGQGTTFYPERKKYSLVSGALPFGIGGKFNVTERLSVGLEWGMRWTFTDFLDDVSGTYANPEVLDAENGVYQGNMSVARELADRSTTPDILNTDRQRGNSTTNDWYSFLLVTVSYNIKARPPKCPAYQ